MKNEKEILKKLVKIAIKQQQIINKLASQGPRKKPGEPLEDWERLDISEEEWDQFNYDVDEEEERLREERRKEKEKAKKAKKKNQ